MSDPAATVIIMDYEQVTGILASMRLDPYCSLTPRFLGVVDANAILSSVDNDCRKGPHWRSRLLRMTSGGTAVLYAPDHIYTEVYRRLPKIARSSPVPLDALRERFEAEYLPALRYVTVDTAAIADPQVLAITDPDDVPTGQLAKLIAPCVVFSEDRHLRKPGLAPPAWREAAEFAVDLAGASPASGSPATSPRSRSAGEPNWSRSSGGRRASRRGSSAASRRPRSPTSSRVRSGARLSAGT